MADTRFPRFLRVAGSSSPPAANPQVEYMIGVSDPYRLRRSLIAGDRHLDHHCGHLRTPFGLERRAILAGHHRSRVHARFPCEGAPRARRSAPGGIRTVRGRCSEHPSCGGADTAGDRPFGPIHVRRRRCPVGESRRGRSRKHGSPGAGASRSQADLRRGSCRPSRCSPVDRGARTHRNGCGRPEMTPSSSGGRKGEQSWGCEKREFTESDTCFDLDGRETFAPSLIRDRDSKTRALSKRCSAPRAQR
jgi:hypothetical protein